MIQRVDGDTHLTLAVFDDEIHLIWRYGLTVEWKMLDVSWEVLLARDGARCRRPGPSPT